MRGFGKVNDYIVSACILEGLAM